MDSFIINQLKNIQYSAHTQLISDNLNCYCPLIRAWHEKAAEGDTFSRFVFQYLAFIAYVKNILYFDVSSDRLAIQRLKRDERIRGCYLDRVSQDEYLQKCWAEIIEELNRKPLHNSSYDLDSGLLEDGVRVLSRLMATAAHAPV